MLKKSLLVAASSLLVLGMSSAAFGATETMASANPTTSSQKATLKFEPGMTFLFQKAGTSLRATKGAVQVKLTKLDTTKLSEKQKASLQANCNWDHGEQLYLIQPTGEQAGMFCAMPVAGNKLTVLGSFKGECEWCFHDPDVVAETGVVIPDYATID